jgi:hypothetical protein
MLIRAVYHLPLNVLSKGRLNMRVIERQMLEAVRKRKGWRNGNTEVRVNDGAYVVLLHGNPIISGELHADGYSYSIVPDRATLARWPTPTTKSRLRAFGVNVTTRKHVTYLNGEPV